MPEPISCPSVSANFIFLGSNRLPHCDPSSSGDTTCPPTEIFYAGETLRWQVNINISGSLVIVGNPSIAFRIIGTESIVRYATLNLSNSNLVGKTLEFVYTLQGTDIGTIPSMLDFYTKNISFVSDDNNKIVYPAPSCPWSSNSVTDINLLSNMDRVSVNGGTSLNTNNNARLLIKRSNTPNKVPLATDLLDGELALNTADNKLFFKNSSGVVIDTVGVIETVLNTKSPINSPILSLGTLSGSNAINFGSDRLFQTLTLNGNAVTFTKGTGWPSTSVTGDIILKVVVSSATSITWSIVNDWFSQPPAGSLSVGTHLFLLRAIGGSTIEGHYIGSKTN